MPCCAIRSCLARDLRYRQRLRMEEEVAELLLLSPSLAPGPWARCHVSTHEGEETVGRLYSWSRSASQQAWRGTCWGSRKRKSRLCPSPQTHSAVHPCGVGVQVRPLPPKSDKSGTSGPADDHDLQCSPLLLGKYFCSRSNTSYTSSIS